jgi:mRNA interferase MazF
VLVVQGDAFNRSRIATVVCVVLTTQLKWAEAPGNLRLSERDTGLPKASVANASQLVTLDKASLVKRVGKLSKQRLSIVLTGIDVVLGR